MTNQRWTELMNDRRLMLSAREMAQGWHFCPDNDGLLIGPGSMELHWCCCDDDLADAPLWKVPGFRGSVDEGCI